MAGRIGLVALLEGSPLDAFLPPESRAQVKIDLALGRVSSEVEKALGARKETVLQGENRSQERVCQVGETVENK